MGLFGLSFGASKTSEKSNTVANKTEDITGTQNTNTQGTQSTTGLTTQKTDQTQTGNQNQTGNTSQSGVTTGTQKQTSTTTSLDSGVQDALSAAVKSTLSGGINASTIASLSNMIAGRTGFNADGFVKDQVQAARTRGEETLQETQSGIQSSVGGSATTNSMAALLGERGRNDLESSIAGVRANAVQTAAGISNQNLQAASGAESSLATSGTYLASALKGASVTSDSSTLTDQLNKLLGANSGNTNTSQNTAGSSTQQSSTNQLISQIVSALTQQKDVSTATQATTGQTKKFGGGFSIG